MSNEFKRQVAYKIEISEIANGVYRREEGSEPNHVMTGSGMKVSRANIVAVVVSKSTEGGHDVLIIDDGTGKIAVRAFENKILNGVEVGDFIMVVGKPREFGNEKYLIPEIVRKLPDSRWLEVRKKELSVVQVRENDEISQTGDKKSINDFGDIIETIRKIDSGTGAEISQLIRSGVDEKSILYLMQRGDVYEIRPGRLKILE